MAFSLLRIVSRDWISCFIWCISCLLKGVLKIWQEVIHHWIYWRGIYSLRLISIVIIFQVPIVVQIVLKNLTWPALWWLQIFLCLVFVIFACSFTAPWRATLLRQMGCAWMGWFWSLLPIYHVLLYNWFHQFVSCKLSWLVLVSARQYLPHSEKVSWFPRATQVALLWLVMATILI